MFLDFFTLASCVECPSGDLGGGAFPYNLSILLQVIDRCLISGLATCWQNTSANALKEKVQSNEYCIHFLEEAITYSEAKNGYLLFVLNLCLFHGICGATKISPFEANPNLQKGSSIVKKYHRRWRQHRAITVDTDDTVDTVDTVDRVDTVRHCQALLT